MRRALLWLARWTRDRILESKAWERQFTRGGGWPPPAWVLKPSGPYALWRRDRRAYLAPWWMRTLKRASQWAERTFQEVES